MQPHVNYVLTSGKVSKITEVIKSAPIIVINMHAKVSVLYMYVNSKLKQYYKATIVYLHVSVVV